MVSNITGLIAGYDNPSNYLTALCTLSDHWMAYGILIIIGISVFMWVKLKAGTIYTAMPVSLLFTWGVSLIFVFMTDDGVNCVDPRISIAIFISLVLATIVRVLIKDY